MSGCDPAGLYAHSPSRTHGRWHRLDEHVRRVAELARRFADPFGAGDLAYGLGLFHDAGKASCAWQDGLTRAAVSNSRVGIDHKALGTQLLAVAAGPAVLAIDGHHGGLNSVEDIKAVRAGGRDEQAEARFFAAVPEARDVLALPPGALLPAAWQSDRLAAEIGIRMAFSALCDADHLDTGAHFADYGGPVTRSYPAMGTMLDRFTTARAALLGGRSPSPVDAVRQAVYDQCVTAAAGAPGIYRLPAPTGSGKTISAAGFALHHAARHGKRRVIVAVPFTTITEQNADVYRSLLGEDVVLEHHTNAELDDPKLRYAAENWDAPFVITTTVQLFESLFGRKPSRSRKLHRIAGSVIVLDEVQALPLQVLAPILDVLRLLVEHFGVTVLLTTATQPAFELVHAWHGTPITEVIADPQSLFAAMARVSYEWRGIDAPPPDLDQLAAEAASFEQVLVVVNTVSHAREMFTRLRLICSAESVLHLSTRMTQSHRRDALATVRARLARSLPVRLVSTQLIEAGVDLDFPVVMREVAPAESLQQAAGRANREGKLAGKGRVIVFAAAGWKMTPFYDTAWHSTRLFFGPGNSDPDDIARLPSYYRHLYSAVGVNQPPPDSRAATINDHRAKLDYRSVTDGPLNPGTGSRDRTRAFLMIDDDSVPVVVTARAGDDPVGRWLDELRAGTATVATFRLLRKHVVTVPSYLLNQRGVRELIMPITDDASAAAAKLYEWIGVYDNDLGIDESAPSEDTIW